MYPNPFNPGTQVIYTVPSAGPVSLSLYDSRGRLVDQIIRGEHRDQGEYEFLYSPQVASGVYLLRLESAGHSKMTKLALLK